MSGAGPLLAIAVAEAAEVQGETASDGGDGDRPGLSHWFCCLEDRGICGTKLDGEEIHDEEPAECVVCRAMEDQPCEVTCEPWLGQAG